MNTFTLLILHLPVFIITYSIHLLIIKLKNKKDYYVLSRKYLNFLNYIVLIILCLELISWFVIPAYNYAF